MEEGSITSGIYEEVRLDNEVEIILHQSTARDMTTSKVVASQSLCQQVIHHELKGKWYKEV